MKNFLLQTFFFLEMQTNFFTHIIFASNLFSLFMPCKQFVSIFFIVPPPPPPSRKIMVRPLVKAFGLNNATVTCLYLSIGGCSCLGVKKIAQVTGLKKSTT